MVPSEASRVVRLVVFIAFDRERLVDEGGAAGSWLVEGGGKGGQ